MKRIFNYCTMLLVSVLAFSLGSCTDEYEYTPAVAEGEQIYFSNALSSTVELNSNQSSIQIPVNRIQRSGALTVPIEVTVPENSKYKVSSEVTFNDGDSVAYINVNYDPSAIEYGKYDTITVAVKDAQYTTPYGASTYTFAAGMSEWKTMSSKGYYRDGIVGSIYGIGVSTYQVEIQENVLTPGKYRVISPYGEGTDFYSKYVDIDSPAFTWTGETNTSFIIDATDPNFVYIDGDFYTGLDDGMASQGQGALHVFSYVYLYLTQGNSLDAIKANAPELFGKLEDGVITFPEKCLLGNFDDSMNPMYYANSADLAVALPGHEIKDYTTSFAYTGHFIDVAGNNYAQGTITLGTDVASAKYIVAADGDDVNEIINAVNEGSIEATEIKATSEVKVPIAESGTYNMIVIAYDSEGQMRSSSSTSFTFSIGGSGSTNWQAVCTGTYDQNYYPNFIKDENENMVGNPFGDGTYSTTLYVDADDQNHLKIEPWLMNNLSLEFNIDDNGIISFSDINTGVDSKTGYGNILVTNANEIFPNNGPFSCYTQEGLFAFGMMYYVVYNNDYGWLGGATETFTPSQNSAAAKILKRSSNILSRNKAVNNCKKSVNAGHKKNFIALPFNKTTMKMK